MKVHATALVSPEARLGTGFAAGPFAVVEAGARIGSDCEIGAHAVVRGSVVLGDGNRVHEGAVLGGDPQDLSFKGGETRVVIGDRNRIREGVTIHRSAQAGGATAVGSDCFLMAYVHLAHDDRIGDRVVIANNTVLAGHVQVGDGAFLSGSVGVHQFCRIGRLAMVGGVSKVVQDCLPFVISDGHPARPRGLNVVGLRRAGVPAAQIRTLREGYRLLVRSALPREEALARMAALGDPLVDEMASFVRGSKRGFARPRRGEPDAD
jgi:UDP-N-acetylglucosamine acyltransferase